MKLEVMKMSVYTYHRTCLRARHHAVLQKCTHAVPGQFVAVKPLQDPNVKSNGKQWTFYPLASSPYAVHRESADLDASIIEVNAATVL